MTVFFNMNSFKIAIVAAVFGGVLALAGLGLAAEQGNASPTKNAKPYPFKTCIVSGEKLDGDMGKPYVFVEQGQVIKLCCKSCLKDFKKEPSKYLKRIAEAQKGEKKPSAPGNDHGGPQQ